MAQAFESRSPATTRSQIMLETVSEMVYPRGYPYVQTRIQMRGQGDQEWAYTIFASDAPSGIEAVARREADLGIINPGGPLTMAYRGKGPFREPVPVRAITVIPSVDWLGFAVRESSGLASLADVKSREYPLRVSLRSQRDHSVHLYTDEVLKAYGFSVADIEAWGGHVTYDYGTPMDGPRIAMLRAGEVDAIFDEAVTRFIPPAVELGMRFLPLEEPILKQMEDLGFRRGTMSRKQFPMLPADVPALDFSGWPLFTRADVPEDFIYNFCRALDARKARVAWQQPGPLPLDTMCRDTPEGPLDVPLHPGAERYWREVGYLK